MQKQSIKKFFKKIKIDPLFKLDIYYYLIYVYIIVASAKLFTLIIAKEPDFNSIMFYVNGGIILIATLALLAFTYASALKDDPEKKNIIISGKHFIKSLLYFVGGVIFSIGFGDARNHPSNLLGSSGIMLVLSAITDLIILLSGIIMFFLSALFLVIGIRRLSKSL